jgi:hypothetical protein
MKRINQFILAIAFPAFLLISGISCRKSDPYDISPSKISSTPKSSKRLIPPIINAEEMKVLRQFNPAAPDISLTLRGTDEIYSLSNERSYAYNEYNDQRIVYYMYGGTSGNQITGRWFNRKILQWDEATHNWRIFFDDGIQYFSSMTDQIEIPSGYWYYTLQWVWDPVNKKWIKFDADLLVH